MPSNPYHVYEAIAFKKRAPETELERSLYVVIHGKEALNEAVPLRPWEDSSIVEPRLVYPYSIFDNPEIKGILEAFLLAAPDDNEVSDALSMDLDEVTAYRSLFFDTNVFRTQLERIAFLRNIPESNPNKKLYRIAFHQGLGALRWQFCSDKGQTTAEEVIRTVMTDAFYRSLENRGLPLNNQLIKEATNHAKLSLECARTLVREQSAVDANSQDLRIKFEEIRSNRTVHDLQEEGEVLH